MLNSKTPNMASQNFEAKWNSQISVTKAFCFVNDECFYKNAKVVGKVSFFELSQKPKTGYKLATINTNDHLSSDPIQTWEEDVIRRRVEIQCHRYVVSNIDDTRAICWSIHSSTHNLKQDMQKIRKICKKVSSLPWSMAHISLHITIM